MTQLISIEICRYRSANLVEPGDTSLEAAQRFLQRFLKIAADCHDFAY